MTFKDLISEKQDFVYMSTNIKDFSEDIENNDEISAFEDLLNNIEKLIGKKNWSFSKYGSTEELTFTVKQSLQKKFFDLADSFGLKVK